MFGGDERTSQAFSDAWLRMWWPIIALAFGVGFIVVGGILFSS